MRLANHVACVCARGVVHADLWWRKLWEKDNVKGLFIDGGQY